MIAAISRVSRGVLVMEYAIGPQLKFGDGKTPLYQDGQSLLQLLDRYGARDSVLVVEVEANFSTRYNRNTERGDSIPVDAFMAFAGDEGEIHAFEHRLGDRYIYMDNNGQYGQEDFFWSTEGLYREFILPWARPGLVEQTRKFVRGALGLGLER